MPAPSTQHPAPSTQSALPLTAAVVFCAAGVLKIVEVVQSGPLAAWPVEFLLSAAVFEIALAAWFVRHRQTIVSNIAGLALFSCLGLSAGMLYALGSSSCPCFGPLHVHPGVIVALDVALAGLFAWRLRDQIPASLLGCGREFLKQCCQSHRGVTFILTLAVTPVAVFTWNRMTDSIPIRIRDAPIHIDRLSPSQKTRVAIEVINESRYAARIFGGGTSCGCLTLTDLPVVVGANEAVTLNLELKAPPTTGHMVVRFVYYIEHPEQYHLSGSIQAEVVSIAAGRTPTATIDAVPPSLSAVCEQTRIQAMTESSKLFRCLVACMPDRQSLTTGPPALFPL